MGGFREARIRWVAAALGLTFLGLLGAGAAAAPAAGGRAAVKESSTASKGRQAKAGRRFQGRHLLREPDPAAPGGGGSESARAG